MEEKSADPGSETDFELVFPGYRAGPLVRNGFEDTQWYKATSGFMPSEGRDKESYWKIILFEDGINKIEDRIKLEHLIRKTISICRYKKDKKDYWQNPQETVILGTGDCEDICIFWYYILYSNEIRSVMVTTKHKYYGHHAILLVYFQGKWQVMDPMSIMPYDPKYVVDRLRPILSFEEAGLRRFHEIQAGNG